MDLMEYKARELFVEAQIPVPGGMTVSSADELDGTQLIFPCVVKAQVAIGGRGKAGGVKMADDPQQLKKAADEILGMDIKGHIVERIMVVEKVEIKSEFYLSIMLDRNTKSHVIIFSPRGGMDIEQTAKTEPEMIYKIEINPLFGYNEADGRYLGGKAGLDPQMQKSLSSVIEKLYGLCRKRDCMLTEINPLVVSESGEIIAVDAKISIDDSALARQKDLLEFKKSQKSDPLIKEADSFNFLYIPCDSTGDVVVMSNGSGMLMSCIDHLTNRGRTVSAVLDLGGGATADRIRHAVRILFSTVGAKQLFINIFGGITRCDEVAAGIRAAITEDGVLKHIVVRFEGTNKEKGLEIIKGLENVEYVDGLLSGVDAIVKEGAVK